MILCIPDLNYFDVFPFSLLSLQTSKALKHTKFSLLYQTKMVGGCFDGFVIWKIRNTYIKCRENLKTSSISFPILLFILLNAVFIVVLLCALHHLLYVPYLFLVVSRHLPQWICLMEFNMIAFCSFWLKRKSFDTNFFLMNTNAPPFLKLQKR